MTGLELTQGWLEAFEPDVLVASEDETTTVGWGRRHMAFESLVENADDGRPQCTDVLPLYRHLYEMKYGFELRQPVDAIVPSCSSNAVSRIVAATFGCFPPDHTETAGVYERAYRQVFSPRDADITPATLYPELQAHCPLSVGHIDLDVRRGRAGGLGGVTLYIVDPGRALDLIEYWNLRAVDLNVLPVPLPWLSDMNASYEWLLNQVVGDADAERRPRLLILAGRGVSKEYRHQLAQTLRSLAGDSIDVQLSSYPRVWTRWGREADGFHLPLVSAEEDAQQSEIADRQVTFRELVPEFAARVEGVGRAGWVNVIRLRNFGGDPHFPEVFPPGLDDLGGLLRDHSLDTVWANSEGIAVLSGGPPFSRNWRVPTGDQVIGAMLAEHGLKLTLSDAGMVAAQFAHRLRWRAATGVLADLSLIQFLGRMADGYVAPRHHLLEILKRDSDPFPQAPENRLRLLIDAGLFRIGLEVQCEVCRSRNWVDVEALSYTLECDRCLEEYNFPVVSPPRSWRYRLSGPPASGGHARGAYTTLLSIRFFESLVRHGGITWTPSFTLTGKAGELEADFALLLRRSEYSNTWPNLLFGEAKTENDFERKDKLRLEQLARTVPGAFLVAATLKDSLSKDEKALLLPLARAAWSPGGPRRLRSHLIILTGRELLSNEIGGWGATQGRVLRFHGPDAMQELAAFTQRENIDFDPYAELYPE